MKYNSWKKAFFASPGPRTIKEALFLFFKGVCMGSADIIPGVSGGTIALITGIYEKLLAAIKSFDLASLSLLFKGDLRGVVARLHLRFLMPLFAGILLAVVTLARVMHYLLNHQPVHTWSLFFGLILASIFVVGRSVKGWAGTPFISFLAGTILAYFVVGMIPVTTPQALWFIFLSGFIAICAMILPGLSGAFLLLILGKYAYVTGALKNPFDGQNLVIILVFCLGCLGGITLFSRFLNWLLARYHNLTLAFLTGLMAGSMRKIWPWKKVLETVKIRDKVHVLSDTNILPPEFNTTVIIAIVLATAGFVAVIALEKISREKE